MRTRRTRSPEGSRVSDLSTTHEPSVPRGHGIWRVEKALAGFRRVGDRAEQAPPRGRLRGEPPVSPGRLQQVVDEYRHVHEEHRRAGSQGRTRRQLEVQLRQVRERFERLLTKALMSDADRRRWQAQLWESEAALPESVGVRPLLFCGRSDSGSELRLAATPEGTVEAAVDGAVVARFDRGDELLGTTPGLVFSLDGRRFRETFGVSTTCLADLRDAEETSRRPRGKYLRELVEDGLVDGSLDLTARGRRALALDREPARHADVGPEPAISIRGSVPSRARKDLARALVHVAAVSPRPVLRITASLDRHEDPALDRPFVAKATLDVNGRTVRAHVAAASVSEAIHLLESRLKRNLHALAERDVAARREGQVPEPGEWKHGATPPPRPSTASRPLAERRLVRRKTYASAPMTPEAAAAEMLLLDHDFHVFVDATTGEDALVHSRPDGVLALRRQNGSGSYVEPFVLDAEPVPTIGVEDAIEWLTLTNEPFLFFVDSASGRGAALYRRHDGNYGLVSPTG
jgi:hypothetical protein